MRTWKVPGYREVREIGRGAGGITVLALCGRTGAPVALRYLPADADRDAVRAEARQLVDLDDPHVVRLLGLVEGDGAAVVTELVDGVSLSAVLVRHGPTEPESALCVLTDVLLGLAAVHARGVVHRGCLPANVLVTRDGECKLAIGGFSGVSAGVHAAAALLVECVTGGPPSGTGTAADHLPEPLRTLALRGPATHAGAFLDQVGDAARAGYGADWEERGRRGLGRRAALLAALFPPAGDAAWPVPAGTGRRPR
jgi:serine/threonine-protein kinase